MNKPWTSSKSKRMTLGPLRPLRRGISGPNHTSVSLESSQHIYKFLPKRALSDDRIMYLGPVVVAQQVLDPSPQTSYHWKEKGVGGVHPLQPSLQESNPRV